MYHFQWLVIGLHCKWLSQYIGVEPLTSEYNGKELSFYVCVPCLSVCEALAGICNWLAFLQYARTKSSLGGICLYCHWFSSVIVMKRLGGTLGNQILYLLEACEDCILLEHCTEWLSVVA